MKRRAVLGILILGTLASCQWFATRESRTRALVEEEISGIDWNQVDQFPLFDACDEGASRFKQQDCFESILLAHVSEAVQAFDFQAEKTLRDTIYIDFTIDQKGGIEVLSVGDHPLIARQKPDFRAEITRSLKTLPRLQPALKRGVPVATRFRIPLVLQTHE